MRHVNANTIHELRVFSTVEALTVAARSVAAHLRSQTSQPRFFLTVFSGDGGYRGCFFSDDGYYRDIVGEVAGESGLIVAAQIAE